MKKIDKLNILWTTTNKDTITNMISMYSTNALSSGWWDQINIIIWGASAKLIGEDEDVQAEVREMLNAGVRIEACLSCSDKFGVTEALRNLDLDVKYMGEPLTDYLKNDEKILTI